MRCRPYNQFPWRRLIRSTLLCCLLSATALLPASNFGAASPQDPQAGSGEIIIETVPSGTLVSIDGKPEGSSPVKKLLSEGDHTYSVQCARGGIWTSQFSVAAGNIRTYSVSCPTPLRPIPEGTAETHDPQGNFVLDTSPPGIRVVIDRKYRGTSPLRMGLAPGHHKLAVKCPGVTIPTDLEIEKGIIRNYVLTCDDRPQAAALGDILIATQPPGLKLTIDGASRGPSPAEVTLASGRHTYVVECPNDDRYTKSLTVPPNGKKSYNIVCTAQ